MTSRHCGLRVLPPESSSLNPAKSDSKRSLPDDDVLTIRVRHKPRYVLVAVAGEVDMATAARLRERLRALAASGRPIVADLDQVSFIDAAGMGVLAGAAGLAAEHGGSLRVVCARPQTRRLFGFTGLDRTIPLARTLSEALLALEGPPGADIRWSPVDPDVLREALAALRRLA